MSPATTSEDLKISPNLRVVSGVHAASVAGYRAPTCGVRGGATSRDLTPSDESLWLVEGELESGAQLVWEDGHGDEALYVIEGELEVEGRICPSGGALVLEAGARAHVGARTATRIAHFGPSDPAPPDDGPFGPPAPDGKQIHVVGPAGRFAAQEDGRDTRLFADGSCPTCRLFLLYTARTFGYMAPPHSHSQDELIYMLWGRIRFGGATLGPGDSAFVRAHQRYAFRAGPEGFGFLNYRRDASRMTYARDGTSLIEGGNVPGLERVDDLR